MANCFSSISPGQEQGHPGNVPVVLAGLVGTAQDHVLDQCRVDAGAIDDGSDRRGREIVRPNGGKGPAVAPDRGAHGGDDPRFAQGPMQVAGHGSIVGGAAGGPAAPVDQPGSACRIGAAAASSLAWAKITASPAK